MLPRTTPQIYKKSTPLWASLVGKCGRKVVEQQCKHWGKAVRKGESGSDMTWQLFTGRKNMADWYLTVTCHGHGHDVCVMMAGIYPWPWWWWWCMHASIHGFKSARLASSLTFTFSLFSLLLATQTERQQTHSTALPLPLPPTDTTTNLLSSPGI